MTNQSRNERVKQMIESIPAEWDKRPLGLAEEVATFLKSVKDEGTGVDSGTGSDSADLWVTVQGIEYYINIRRSNNQLAKDGKLLPPNAEGK